MQLRESCLVEVEVEVEGTRPSSSSQSTSSRTGKLQNRFRDRRAHQDCPTSRLPHIKTAPHMPCPATPSLNSALIAPYKLPNRFRDRRVARMRLGGAHAQANLTTTPSAPPEYLPTYASEQNAPAAGGADGRGGGRGGGGVGVAEAAVRTEAADGAFSMLIGGYMRSAYI